MTPNTLEYKGVKWTFQNEYQPNDNDTVDGEEQEEIEEKESPVGERHGGSEEGDTLVDSEGNHHTELSSDSNEE